MSAMQMSVIAEDMANVATPAVVLFLGCRLIVLGERPTALRRFAVQYELKALDQRISLIIYK
jgi:hypothetical protein